MDMNIMRMKGRTKMMRTIKVTGKGKIAVKPDMIRLYVNKEELCKEYDGRGGIDFKCLCTSENIRRKRLYSKEDGCFQSNSNLVRKVITLSNKVYVDVLAEFSKDGLLIPKEITWEDGRKYEITRVKDKRRAASTRAGGVGERYTCVVDGKEIFLFYEDNNMWFMERAGA